MKFYGTNVDKIIIDTNLIQKNYLNKTFEMFFFMPSYDNNDIPTKRQLLNYARARKMPEYEAQIFSSIFDVAFLPEVCSFMIADIQRIEDVKLVYERNKLFNSHAFKICLRKSQIMGKGDCYINLARTGASDKLSSDEYKCLSKKIHSRIQGDF